MADDNNIDPTPSEWQAADAPAPEAAPAPAASAEPAALQAPAFAAAPAPARKHPKHMWVAIGVAALLLATAGAHAAFGLVRFVAFHHMNAGYGPTSIQRGDRFQRDAQQGPRCGRGAGGFDRRGPQDGYGNGSGQGYGNGGGQNYGGQFGGDAGAPLDRS